MVSILTDEEIEVRVNSYRYNLYKEREAIVEYYSEFGRMPCCVKQAITGDCLCWQSSWC